MSNRYYPTEEQKEKFIPILQDFIDQIEAGLVETV